MGNNEKQKEVLVLGAGYAGIRVIHALQKKHDGIRLTLVNDQPYHCEKTALHELASGCKNREAVCYPLSEAVDERHTHLIYAEVVKVDVEARRVELRDAQPLPYDYLVIALGFQPETFGIPGAMENALQMSDADSAEAIYAHLQREYAAWREDHDPAHLRIAVCGAGFTGIELIGALLDQASVEAGRYGFSPEQLTIHCVEAATKLLPMFPEDLTSFGIDYLKNRGVDFRVGAKITRIDKGVVCYSQDDQEKLLPANTIIWTVGVRGSHVMGDSGFAEKRGRVLCEEDLSLSGHSEIFVLGDVCAAINPDNGRPWPTTAQIALAMADTAAANLISLIEGQKTELFAFHSKGTVCSLGNAQAIAVVGKRRLKGYSASALKKIIADRSLMIETGKLRILFSKGRFDLYH